MWQVTSIPNIIRLGLLIVVQVTIYPHSLIIGIKLTPYHNIICLPNGSQIDTLSISLVQFKFIP